MATLRVKLLTENATVPTRGSEQAAGWDLYAAEPVIVTGRGKAIIPTDIAVAIAPNHYGRVVRVSTSGLKHSGPCQNCLNTIRQVGIKKIVFSDNDGCFEMYNTSLYSTNHQSSGFRHMHKIQ